MNIEKLFSAVQTMRSESPVVGQFSYGEEAQKLLKKRLGLPNETKEEIGNFVGIFAGIPMVQETWVAPGFIVAMSGDRIVKILNLNEQQESAGAA